MWMGEVYGTRKEVASRTCSFFDARIILSHPRESGLSTDSDNPNSWFGTQEGRDGYDVTEELAKMEWCNGSVAFVGNSWLGMAQWFIAAERPLHLKCIAPFEGASDTYREMACRGGVPTKAFIRFITSALFGKPF